MKSAARLAERLRRGSIVVPGVYDALGAHLVRAAGFDAVYVSGGGLSVAGLGLPDTGVLTLDEVARVAGRVARASSLPVIVDADTGFGGPAHVADTMRRLRKAGAAAVQIEDQVAAKKCGHLGGKRLISPAAMAAKIRAAVRARGRGGPLVIARTDARSVEGFEAALARARLYRAAGADILFPEALLSRAEFAAFGNKGLGTLLANMTEFGRSPAFTARELSLLGYRLILYPMTALRVAAFAMTATLTDLHRQGTSRKWLPRMQTRRDLYDLIDYDEDAPRPTGKT